MSFKSNSDIKPFDHRVWLSSPTMHGEEALYMMEAFNTNWMSTVGENINSLESMAAEFVGVRYAVGLSSGTSAIHLAVKLAGEHCIALGFVDVQHNAGELRAGGAQGLDQFPRLCAEAFSGNNAE